MFPELRAPKRRTGLEQEPRRNPRKTRGLRRQAADNKKPTAFAVGFSWLTKRDECTTVLRL